MKRLKVSLILILLVATMLVTNAFGNMQVSAVGEHNITAKSYVVIDKNGKVLLDKNMNDKREVASICKLMTTLLTFEEIDRGNLSLDDYVIASEYACAVEGSQAFLDAGQEYQVRDLLKSVIVASANDSAIVLAENIAGNETAFAKLMNARAKELGMENTLYANATGLSDSAMQQYSTCLDTAIILNQVSEYDLYGEYSQIWMDKLVHPSGRATELVNTNRLIKYYPYCRTGKTGFTDEAGYCLSSTALKDDLKLTCVVLGSNSSANRFTDSVALYSNAYSNFASEKIINKDELITSEVKVEKGKEDKIKVKYADDFYLTLSKRNKEDYNIVYELVESVKAPINIGDKVGVARVILGGEEVGSVSLVADSIVSEQNYKDIVNKIISKLPIIK